MRSPAIALAVCAMLAGCGATLGPVTPGEGQVAQVTAVIDGDTIEVRFANGTSETVRLIGIDTPEVRGETTPGEFEGVPDTDDGRHCLRTWGDRASQYTRQRITGRRVRVALDPLEGPRGSYGRLLAYVRLDNRTLNYHLVVRGYARVYTSGFSLQERYLAAEARAQANATGVWNCAANIGTDPTATPAGGVAVTDVQADPPGDDNQALNAEYVVLANGGDGPVSLHGWTVSDTAGHTYTFGNVTLAAGARVTLHTGSGTDSQTDVYWGRNGAVWNNDGDAVVVRDTAGAVVARYQY